MSFLIIVSFSCETEETLGVSKTTDYPVITINGDKTVLINSNNSFNDPGAVAKEGENEIEISTEFSKGVYFGKEFSSKTPDKYTVTYSAENKDGFKGNALRTIWFYSDGDLGSSLEGIYLSDVQRAPSFTPSSQYDDLQYVLIQKTGDDMYTISHAIGGYYDIGRSYGSRYSAGGATIKVNNIQTNDYTISDATIPGWGLSIKILDFVVDSSNNKITYTGMGTFGNGTFKVQLKKVEF